MFISSDLLCVQESTLVLWITDQIQCTLRDNIIIDYCILIRMNLGLDANLSHLPVSELFIQNLLVSLESFWTIKSGTFFFKSGKFYLHKQCISYCWVISRLYYALKGVHEPKILTIIDLDQTGNYKFQR